MLLDCGVVALTLRTTVSTSLWEMHLMTEPNEENVVSQIAQEQKVLDGWNWTGIPEWARGHFADEYYDIDIDMRPMWMDRLPSRPNR